MTPPPVPQAHVVAQIAIELAELAVTADASPIDPATSLFEGGLDLDSFSVVELLGRLEERFGMTFGDDDFTPERFTVGGLAELVAARAGEEAAR